MRGRATCARPRPTENSKRAAASDRSGGSRALLCRRLPGDLRQQAVKLRPATRLGPVGDVELAIDVRQVELDGLLRHPEHLRELRVRVALRDEPEDLDLTLRQPRLRAVDSDQGVLSPPNTGVVDRRLERLTDGRRDVLGGRGLDAV